MKIGIIELTENLVNIEKVNKYYENVMPIFNQGHDIFAYNKYGAFEAFGLNVVLVSDKVMSFPEIAEIVFLRTFKNEPVPEFLGFVSGMESDSLNRTPKNSASNMFRQEIPLNWKTFDPKDFTSDGLIVWSEIFNQMANHFKFVYTIDEFTSLLPVWFKNKNWEGIKYSLKIKKLLKELNSLPSFSGISDGKGNKFISNDQWIEYRNKFMEAVGGS